MVADESKSVEILTLEPEANVLWTVKWNNFGHHDKVKNLIEENLRLSRIQTTQADKGLPSWIQHASMLRHRTDRIFPRRQPSQFCLFSSICNKWPKRCENSDFKPAFFCCTSLEGVIFAYAQSASLNKKFKKKPHKYCGRLHTTELLLFPSDDDLIWRLVWMNWLPMHRHTRLFRTGLFRTPASWRWNPLILFSQCLQVAVQNQSRIHGPVQCYNSTESCT